MNNLTERQLEALFYKLCLQAGALYIKLTGQKGIPDRLVIRQDGQVFFCELKTKKGRLSETQKLYHNKLQNKKQRVVIIRNENDMKKVLYDPDFK
jgi:hypothetical protein